MKLFDVYPLNDICIEKAAGSYVWDDKGEKYLDMYGGHAVISIGHTHPHYVKRIEDQLHKVGFYSNSVKIPIQVELAEKLGRISGKEGYQLFYVIQALKPMRMHLNWHLFTMAEKRSLLLKKHFMAELH